MKRKSTTLLVVLLCLLIVLLIGLGVFMTWLMNAQADMMEEQIRNIQTEAVYPEEDGKLLSQDNSVSTAKQEETAHRFIFVGDSRTLGMQDALQNANVTDECMFIGKVGEGYYWLSHDGIDQLDEALKEIPDATVIFNLGVNDLKEINNYLQFYSEILKKYESASFYIMSVNPVGNDYESISNDEIEVFNEKLEEAFPDRYLDCYSYLTGDDYQTVDGLHYNYSTYLKIHHYVIMVLNQD